MRDAAAGACTPTVERVIEANLLMTGIISGVGGDAFRVALAHGLLYGMTVHPRVHDFLHGEVVSYGLVVQACLERHDDEAARLIAFFDELGLPLTLADLGLGDREDPRFREGLRRTCAAGGSAHNITVPVDEAGLLRAILDVDERVAAWRRSPGAVVNIPPPRPRHRRHRLRGRPPDPGPAAGRLPVRAMAPVRGEAGRPPVGRPPRRGARAGRRARCRLA